MKEIEIDAHIRMKAEVNDDYTESKIHGTYMQMHSDDFSLLDATGMMNAEGHRVMSSILISGLVSNIHIMHQKGWRDSAEHFRMILRELEQGFIQSNVTLKKILIDDNGTEREVN